MSNTETLIWLAFILAEVLRNWFIIERKRQRPNYGKSFMLRAIAGLVLTAYSLPLQWNTPFIEAMHLVVPYVFELCAWFFVVFTVVLNNFRKKELFHLGSESGWLDQIGTGDYPQVYWILYGMCLMYIIL